MNEKDIMAIDKVLALIKKCSDEALLFYINQASQELLNRITNKEHKQ